MIVWLKSKLRTKELGTGDNLSELSWESLTVEKHPQLDDKRSDYAVKRNNIMMNVMFDIDRCYPQYTKSILVGKVISKI